MFRHVTRKKWQIDKNRAEVWFSWILLACQSLSLERIAAAMVVRNAHTNEYDLELYHYLAQTLQEDLQRLFGPLIRFMPPAHHVPAVGHGLAWEPQASNVDDMNSTQLTTPFNDNELYPANPRRNCWQIGREGKGIRRGLRKAIRRRKVYHECVQGRMYDDPGTTSDERLNESVNDGFYD